MLLLWLQTWICEWIEEHGFKLNINKVKVMVVSRFKNNKPLSPQLVLQGESLEYIDLLLGVTITSDLSWRTHILETITKAKCLLGRYSGRVTDPSST